MKIHEKNAKKKQVMRSGYSYAAERKSSLGTSKLIIDKIASLYSLNR